MWQETSQRARCLRANPNPRPTTASRPSTRASRRASPATRADGRRKTCRHCSPPHSTRRVTVTENGKRRQVTKREPVIAQLVNKSASAKLRATKMLIDMLRDIEKKAEPTARAKSPFTPTDKEVMQQLIARLRRDMCDGCPWAAQRGVLDSRTLAETPRT